MEVRPSGVNKGVMAQSVLRRHNVTTGPRGSNPDPLSRPDDTLVLCIGDDDADEAMFKAVKEYVRKDLILVCTDPLTHPLYAPFVHLHCHIYT